MAKALTTSEANKYLLKLGYDQYHDNYIEDNDFTLPFGKTSYYIEETTNMFDEEGKYRWWDFIGLRFSLNISENSRNGRSYLGIFLDTETKRECVVKYTDLNAEDKKKFIGIFEKLSKKKKTFKLDREICDPTHTYWGNVKPKKIIELKK